MQRYRFKLEVVVEVDAFDEDDAEDVVDETFGVGTTGVDVEVKEMTVVDCQPL